MSTQAFALAHLAEWQGFMARHPESAYVDALFVDLSGIVRGKRIPIAEAEKLFIAGIQLPYSVYLLDVTGGCPDVGGRGFSDGDPDGVCRALTDTLKPVDLGGVSAARVMMTVVDQNGASCDVEPRWVAAQVLDQVHQLGLHPVVAFELEFYLFDQERPAGSAPLVAKSLRTGARDHSTQVYGIAQLDAFGEFFRAVQAQCVLQDIPVSVATSEFSAGQYEINLRYESDPLRAADSCALLRHIIRLIAADYGMVASFMSKPFGDSAGSGMHVHMSLCDGAGHNIFSDGPCAKNQPLLHAIGGILETVPESFAICAPSANAYRRYLPNTYVPVTRSWAENNRSVTLRIPAGEATARRFEHRLAGADANPYLVLAAILAGVHHGLTNRIDPGAPFEGNAGDVDPDLPLNWEAAVDRLRQGALLTRYLGRHYVDLYCDIKRAEIEKFALQVTPLEYDWYL